MIEDFDFSKVDRSRPWALFLDIDGTLLEFAATPDAVIVPLEVPELLQRLDAQTKGGMAIVTGRPIESADRLFAPIQFTMAGLHGGEFRYDSVHEIIPAPVAPQSWREEAKALSRTFPGVKYEEKHFGFAIHYRNAPEAGEAVRAAVEEMILHDNPGFHLLAATMALEIRPDGIDKGTAIRRFMELPAFAGRHPLFFGDDTTDDDGFRTVRELGGTAVLVGGRRPAEADYCVKDPQAMRQMLSELTLAA